MSERWHHGISHHLLLLPPPPPPPPPPPFFESLQYVSHLRVFSCGEHPDRLCWLKEYWMQSTVQFKKKKKLFQMRAQRLSQRPHPPLSTSSFLSHTYACPILLHSIHFLLSAHFRVLPPFLSPLWRMNGLVSGAILCPSRRSGVCAASHWSSKWAGNGAGGPGC